MNSLVGKSTGIALLLAAGLLAALFAMGVFSATGVGAHPGDHCDADGEFAPGQNDNTACPPTHTSRHAGVLTEVGVTIEPSVPLATGVKMTLSFTPAVSAGNLAITLPQVTAYDYDAEGVEIKVEQNGASVPGAVVTAANGTVAITYDTAENARNYVAGKAITVTVTGLTNPGADATINAASIVQGTEDPVTADAETSTSGGTLKLSSSVAGDPVQIVVGAWAVGIKNSDDDITIDLKKFGVPTTIPERSIIIADNDGTGEGTPTDDGYIGEPGSVTVNGTKVTLALYPRFPGQSSGDAGELSLGYTITIKQSAGVTNPIVAGTASVQVKDGDPGEHNLTSKIDSKVKLSAAAGARGTEITVSAVGLGKGGATVYLVKNCDDQSNDCANVDADGVETEQNNDISLGNAATSGGKVSIDVETSSSEFIRGAVPIDKDGKSIWMTRDDGVVVLADNTHMAGDRSPASPYISSDTLRGRNRITIVDGTGRTADKVAYFMITPTITVDEDSVQQGDEMDIVVEDWFNDDNSRSHFTVTVGDEDSIIEDTEFDDGDGEIEIIVPPDARLGEQELKVTSTRSTDSEGSLTKRNLDVAKGTVVIGALDMELDPSTVVLGQQFTIKVKGFSTDEPEDDDNTPDVDESNVDPIQLVKVGDVILEATTGGEDIEDLTIDTNGDFTNTFVVKSTYDVPGTSKVAADVLTPGTHRVRVEDWTGRIAIGVLTIPKPSITITPPVSRRGTTVSVVGENFPAARVVQLFYKDNTEDLLQGAVLADSAGKIRLNFSVPSDAEIGEEQDVIAESAANTSKFKAKTSHALPDQEIVVTPTQVSAGGRLSIEGHNMPLFTNVTLKIADINVLGTGFETDGLGSFVRENVLVPQLKPGTHTVEATVQTQGGAAKVRTTIEIVDIITRDSEEAFADIITNGTLTRVWHLDAATQTWSFFDPAPEFADFNTLTQVSSGQIVTIIMSAQDDFQGKTLYVGSNNVAIE